MAKRNVCRLDAGEKRRIVDLKAIDSALTCCFGGVWQCCRGLAYGDVLIDSLDYFVLRRFLVGIDFD